MPRFIDCCISIIALGVLSPIFLFVLVCIRLTSNGSAFFSQQRVGLGGADFKIYKFRSMQTATKTSGGGFDPGDKSRVTRFGALLRKTKIDELPQLYNVLLGDMAIVGPRPEVRKWVDIYPEEWSFIHKIRPGITDPASVKFRNEEDILHGEANPEKYYKDKILPKKLKLYRQYVGEKSFLVDLKIVVQTLVALFMRKGHS